MDEVKLHSFMGKCSPNILDTIFPNSDKRFITFEEMKNAMVFGREQTITFFHTYIFSLGKYEAGMFRLPQQLINWILSKRAMLVAL